MRHCPRRSSLTPWRALDFDAESFDVVHAHQVLQHLRDPVGALRECKRVLRPSGLLAVRDSDYSAFSWAPRDRSLDRWLELYEAVARTNEAEPDAGPRLKGWALAAGFTEVSCSSSTWTFADREGCAFWGSLWADRCELSAFAGQAIAYGLSTRAELAEIAAAFRRWSEQPDAVFILVHGEILARA